jgi:hypothetical protein
MSNNVRINNSNTNVVQVNTPGPQGPQGPSGFNFPFTGSAIITGSLNVIGNITGSIFTPVSGTFVLPITSSAEPNIPTGSAYWSGSFLFIWDGSRYRSSSFS